MKIVGQKSLYEGWGNYLLVTVERADGSRVKREVEHHGDGAAVLAYDPVRRTALFVRQLRIPILLAAGAGETLEVAAGLIDDDEAPETCIRREAMEEMGLRVERLEPVATIQSMPGISTERLHLFLAPYGEGDRVGEGGGLAGEDEQITIVEMPLAELAALADRGELTDAKSLILLQTLRVKHPDLFGAPAAAASV